MMTPTPIAVAIAGAALLAFARRAPAQTPAPPTDDEIRAILAARVEARETPGIVVGLISPAGQRIIAAGRTSLDGGTDVDGDTVFEVGSVSKVFTGLLLADMVHRGEVRLDDPISKYLPASVRAPARDGKSITLLNLATHRSGLPRLPDNLAPRDERNPYADYTFDNLCAFLSDYTLTRDIGEQYEYSNLGMGLLGSLLARRAGTSYEALLTDRVLRPLGMTDTVITLPPRLRARMAAPYNASLEPDHTWEFDALAGCGAIRSTVRDLLKLVAANLQLTPTDLWPALQSMQQPVASTTIPYTRIGISWHITDRDGKRLIWHNGQTGGYHSFVGFDATNKMGVVLLCNSGSDQDDIGFHLLNPSRPLKKPKKKAADGVVTLAAADLDRCVGRYQLAPGIFFDLKRDGPHLMARLTGQSYYEIYPKSKTDFFYKVVDAQITFNGDASGKVQSLTLHQNGADQTADKISDAPAAERSALRLDNKILDAYTGSYSLTSGAVFTIRRDGNRLLARLTGQSFLEIFPESETEFFYKAVDAQITFVKGADGRATALVLHQNGVDQRADKTK